MSKEATIRKHAIEDLLEDGWILFVPTRRRFGSGTTYMGEEVKQADDIFTLFDLIAWKKDEFLLVQYTSKSNIRTREHKIKGFLAKHSLELPCRAEVWGWEDYKDFTSKIKLD